MGINPIHVLSLRTRSDDSAAMCASWFCLCSCRWGCFMGNTRKWLKVREGAKKKIVREGKKIFTKSHTLPLSPVVPMARQRLAQFLPHLTADEVSYDE